MGFQSGTRIFHPIVPMIFFEVKPVRVKDESGKMARSLRTDHRLHEIPIHECTELFTNGNLWLTQCTSEFTNVFFLMFTNVQSGFC